MSRSILATALLLVACGQSEPRLVDPAVIVADSLPTPLTPDPGNIIRGKSVFIDREQGHCVLCHIVQGLEAEFQGNVGPDLSLVADRLSPAQLRLRIVDYQLVRPGALMPSYYRNHDLYQVGETFADAPILSAQQVEDLVAYLSQTEADADDDD
ncbi:MAG: sulfur oxidation c-type cytochrome SoxX [Pseudomonadota bacterium]